MRTSMTFFVAVILMGTALLLGFWGCGYGPLEQSYAIESGAESVNSTLGTAEGEVADLMKQMRTANLNLVDRLTAGTPDQVIRAAVQVSILSRQVGKYQPAIATEGIEEAAAFKRLSHQIQDMAVEVAKACDAGQLAAADQYYVSLFMTCNQCHRLFRGVTAPAEPMEIPEIETPKPPVEEPEEGAKPAPTPTPTPIPGPPEG